VTGQIFWNGVLLWPLAPPVPPVNFPLGALLEPFQGMIVALQDPGPGAVAVKLAPSASVMLSACESSTASAGDGNLKLQTFCPPDSEPVETSP
jgi:hypothetical protein